MENNKGRVEGEWKEPHNLSLEYSWCSCLAVLPTEMVWLKYTILRVLKMQGDINNVFKQTGLVYKHIP